MISEVAGTGLTVTLTEALLAGALLIVKIASCALPATRADLSSVLLSGKVSLMRTVHSLIFMQRGRGLVSPQTALTFNSRLGLSV
jgi:hypothetical protein